MRNIILIILLGIGFAIFNYYPKYTAKKDQEKIHESLKQGVFDNTESILVSSENQPYMDVAKDISYPNATFKINLKPGQQELNVSEPDQLRGQIALDLCHDFNKNFLYPMVDKAPDLEEVLKRDKIQLHYQISSPVGQIIVDDTFNPLSCMNR